MSPSMKNSVSLRDALYQLAVSQRVPDAELLEEFVNRYPQHASALTEFAIEIALESLGEEDDQPIEQASAETSHAVSKAMSRFQNRLYAVKKTSGPSTRHSGAEPENPFASLSQAKLRAIALGLNANSVFVMKLRDRLISVDSMSPGFQQRVAEELKAPMEVVAAHFAADPEIRQLTHFKAKQKPQTGSRQTFEQAVRTSSLTREQQDYLLSL